MIEVNRRLYMDEETGQRTDGFLKIQATIERAMGLMQEALDNAEITE